MVPARMLIIDLNPQACPEDHSVRLAGLLQDGLANTAINIQIMTHVPVQSLSPPPDLVVLRSTSTTSLSETAQSLKQRWSRASLLGLFCFEEDNASTVLQCLRNGLVRLQG